MVDQYLQVFARGLLGDLLQGIEIALATTEIGVKKLSETVDHIYRSSIDDSIENLFLESNLGVFSCVIERRVGREFVASLKQLANQDIDDINALIKDLRRFVGSFLGNFQSIAPIKRGDL